MNGAKRLDVVNEFSVKLNDLNGLNVLNVVS